MPTKTLLTTTVKIFRSKIRKMFQVYRTVSSSNFFCTSKKEKCLEKAAKHILLKSRKNWCFWICLKICFLSKSYSKRLWKQHWQHLWKRFWSKSGKSITFSCFFPDRLLRDRFFSNCFWKSFENTSKTHLAKTL